MTQFIVCGGWPALGGLLSGMVTGWLWHFDALEVQERMTQIVRSLQPSDTTNFCYFLVHFPFCCCYPSQMPQWVQSPVDQLRLRHQQQLLLARSRMQMGEEGIHPMHRAGDGREEGEGVGIMVDPLDANLDADDDQHLQMQLRMLQYLEQQQQQREREEQERRERNQIEINPLVLQHLIEIGFSPAAAHEALLVSQGDPNRAVSLLLNDRPADI